MPSRGPSTIRPDRASKAVPTVIRSNVPKFVRTNTLGSKAAPGTNGLPAAFLSETNTVTELIPSAPTELLETSIVLFVRSGAAVLPIMLSSAPGPPLISKAPSGITPRKAVKL